MRSARSVRARPSNRVSEDSTEIATEPLPSRRRLCGMTKEEGARLPLPLDGGYGTRIVEPGVSEYGEVRLFARMMAFGSASPYMQAIE